MNKIGSNQQQVLIQWEKYLDQYRIMKDKSSKNTCVATHTSMGVVHKKRGTFNIPEDKIDEFFSEYEKVVFDHGIHQYMTERPLLDKGVLKFDLDFKYECDHLERMYSEVAVKKIVEIINAYLKEYLKVDNVSKFNAYIFQRDFPYRKGKLVKDGIHIMYPELYMDYTFHYYIRKKLIDGLEHIKFSSIVPYTNPIADVVDESIIDRNGWLMYGSTKENVNPYKLCYIYDLDLNLVENKMTDKEMCRYFSIRKIISEVEYEKCDWMNFIDDVGRNQKKKKRVLTVENDGGIHSPIENISELEVSDTIIRDKLYIEKLVGILSSERCLNYQSWLEVGLCLHNIGDLFDLWIQFSRQNFSKAIEFLIESRDKEYDEDKQNSYNNDLEDWDEIIKSKKDNKLIQKKITDKYVRDEKDWELECYQKWCHFEKKENGLNIGSLNYWAKKDNEFLFRKIRFHKIQDLIEESVYNPSHGKISAVLYHKYRHQYVCADFGKNVWYEWHNHCWKLMDDVSMIRRRISGTVEDHDCLKTDYEKMRSMAYVKYIDSNDELMEIKKEKERMENDIVPLEVEINDMKVKGYENKENNNRLKTLKTECKQQKEEYDKKLKELKKQYIKPYDDTIQKFLETTSFIDSIVKEAKQQFYVKEFNRKLDADPTLFLFNNGVFDLTNMVFRDGRQEDFISIDDDNKQVNYKEYSMDHPLIKNIEEYFKKVITDDNKREYFLTLIGSCIEGGNNNNIFPILTGSGSNAKSLTMEFIKDCFNKYAGTLNSAFLTQKRNKSSNASPEYHNIVSCRLVTSEESDTTDELNTAIIKEITGNTKISSRTLFQAKMTTKVPQFTAFLICNDLPQVKSLDGGTWRRLNVISFDSKFVDNPEDQKWASVDNVFKINRTLKEEMNAWKEPFMYLLIHKYYKRFKENNKNFKIPECVLEYTNKFKNDNDNLRPYIESHIINSNQSDRLALLDLYKSIEGWYALQYSGEKCPSRNEVKKYFEREFGCEYRNGGWKGKKIVGF